MTNQLFGYRILPYGSTAAGPTIDVGAAATDRDGTIVATFTVINISNPANDTGTITSVETWFNTNATGVKVGTFSRSGDIFTYVDHATLGAVTSGSKQTFSGLSITVNTGDFLAYYCDSGLIENSLSGGGDVYYLTGDRMTAGAQTYTQAAANELSLYGTGNV